MHFSDYLLPTAANSGLLPTLAYFFMVVAMFALAASVVFSMHTRTHVAPEHNTSRVLTACISLVAAISYYFIQDYYRNFLLASEGAYTLMEAREMFVIIGQLRYMDWAITTPLLLIKMFMVVHAGPKKAAKWLTIAVVADLWMIVTGYVGEQQLDAAGNILAAPRLIWGAISTLGYLALVYCLYRVWRDFAPRAKAIEQKTFKYSALTVITLWGVYPIGYILIAVTDIAPAILHIAYSVADVVNKVGVGVAVYLCGSMILEERIDIRSKEHARQRG